MPLPMNPEQQAQVMQMWHVMNNAGMLSQPSTTPSPSLHAPPPSQPLHAPPPPTQPAPGPIPAFPFGPTHTLSNTSGAQPVTPLSYPSPRLPLLGAGNVPPALPSYQAPNRALQTQVNAERLSSSAAHPPPPRRGSRAASSNAASSSGRRPRGAARPAPTMPIRTVRKLVTTSDTGVSSIPIRWVVHFNKEVHPNFS